METNLRHWAACRTVQPALTEKFNIPTAVHSTLYRRISITKCFPPVNFFHTRDCKLWPLTLTYEPDPECVIDEPACQISRSKVISFKSPWQDTETHMCSGPSTKVVGNAHHNASNNADKWSHTIQMTNAKQSFTKWQDKPNANTNTHRKTSDVPTDIKIQGIKL